MPSREEIAAPKRIQRKRTIDFEISKARLLWFREAKKRQWDDDIRDCGWRQMEQAIRADRMRRAKVVKHDNARKLLEIANAK